MAARRNTTTPEQQSFFDTRDEDRIRRLMHALDTINAECPRLSAKTRLYASFLSGFLAIWLSFLQSGKLSLVHSFRLAFWLTFMKDFLKSDMPDFRPSSRHSSTRIWPPVLPYAWLSHMLLLWLLSCFPSFLHVDFLADGHCAHWTRRMIDHSMFHSNLMA